MAAGDTLPGQLNRAILATTDRFFANDVAPDERKCVGTLQQLATVEISEGSDILTSGDLKVEQRARLAFQCVPPLTAVQRADLRSQLTDSIKTTLSTNMPASNVSLSSQQIEDIVDLTLKARDRHCQTSQSTGLIITPGLQIEKSRIQVSQCTDTEIKDAGEQCRTDIQRNAFDSPACKRLNECARSKSDLTLIRSEVSIGDKCPRLEDITSDILAALTLLSDGNKSGEKKERDDSAPSSLSTGAIVAIAVGAILLLLLSAVIVAAVAAKNRQRPPPLPSMPYYASGRNY